MLLKVRSCLKSSKKHQPLGLERYFIGEGCIWNFQNGLDLMYGVFDVDFAYFDNDLSYEKEDAVIRQVEQIFSHLRKKSASKIRRECTFGIEMSTVRFPGRCDRHVANNSKRQTGGRYFFRYAPFGLDDLFGQIVLANKTQITEETYLQKCVKWCKKWETLKIRAF